MPTPKPTKRPRAHGKGAFGSDGLTAKQRAFVRERRADLTAPMSKIMQRAGFEGPPTLLGKHAWDLMAKPEVAAAVYAPDPAKSVEVSDEDLKAKIRTVLRGIIESSASNADKIKACDKLLATIPGGYVPVQIDTRGKLTLESLVSAMGGAPETQALPAPMEETDHG